MTFADRLKQARTQRGMSQSDLARAAGLTRAVISKWEKGDSGFPSGPALQKAANALDISVDELLGPQSRATRFASSKRRSRAFYQLPGVVDGIERHVLEGGEVSSEEKEILQTQMDRLEYLKSRLKPRAKKKKAKVVRQK